MTRGGKRAGAGRPKISNTEQPKKYTFYLLPSEVPYIKGIIKRLHEQKRKEQKTMTMTLKQLLDITNMDNIIDVEYYQPKFNNDDLKAKNFHTDYITSYDGQIEDDMAVLASKEMTEQEYNDSILVNTSVTADFAEWYGEENKDKKVLCVLLQK